MLGTGPAKPQKCVQLRRTGALLRTLWHLPSLVSWKFATSQRERQKLALDSFKKMAEVAQQDTRARIRDKNRFYALILSARVLLDSNSSLGRRERSVSDDSIAVARQHLETIKRELWNSVPRGSQGEFRLVESDLYFRQGKFEEGRGLLLQCLDEASSLGYETQVPIIIEV